MLTVSRMKQSTGWCCERGDNSEGWTVLERMIKERGEYVAHCKVETLLYQVGA